MKAFTVSLPKINPTHLIDGSALLFLLTLCNLHLFSSNFDPDFIFHLNLPSSNTLANMLLHPFVHVSGYHLFLDAAAFIFLYFEIKSDRVKKCIILLMSGIVSLGLVLFSSPENGPYGFCGLSGMAHGLMAVYCLEWMESKKTTGPALFILTALILKCTYEMIAGDAFFSSLHLGSVGQPMPESHAGGMLGGVLGYLFVHRSDRI